MTDSLDEAFQVARNIIRDEPLQNIGADFLQLYVPRRVYRSSFMMGTRRLDHRPTKRQEEILTLGADGEQCERVGTLWDLVSGASLWAKHSTRPHTATIHNYHRLGNTSQQGGKRITLGLVLPPRFWPFPPRVWAFTLVTGHAGC